MADAFPVDWGNIKWADHARAGKCELVQVRATANKRQIVDHMADVWQLGYAPGSLIRVTGSLPNADPEAIVEIFGGLVQAADMSNAWLFSAGLDFGISSVVCDVISSNRHRCSAPLIGVASWSSVQGRDQLLYDTKGDLAQPGSKRSYRDQNPDLDLGTVQLSSGHSHLVLVGTRDEEVQNGSVVALNEHKDQEQLLLEARARSFTFAHDLEAAIVDAQVAQGLYPSARLLLVVAGDKVTLEEVLNYCRAGKGRILLASETGGLASALTEFIIHGKVPADWDGSRESFGELKRLNALAAAKIAQKHLESDHAVTASTPRLDDVDDERSSWPLVEISTDSFADRVRKTILDALLSQADSVELRVRCCVEWDDEKRLQREFTMMPTWSTLRTKVLRDALQLALELENLSAVKACLRNSAPVKDLDLLQLFDKLYDVNSPAKYTLFSGELPTARRAIQLGDQPNEKRSNTRTRVSPIRKFRMLSFKTPIVRKDGFQPLPEEAGDRTGALEREIEDAVLDYYPVEVWAMLKEVSPGLALYWRAKLRKALQDGPLVNGRRSYSAAESYGATRQVEPVRREEQGAQPQEKKQKKIGARWLDIYVWAVLLGNTELSMLLLPACQEPIRAAILGARLTYNMAQKMPLYQIGLKEAAKTHEKFGLSLLDMCDSYDDARRILTTKSRHWNRTVYQLAVQSGLRDFCAHMYCQQLCDDLFRGNLSSETHNVVLASVETPDFAESLKLILGAVAPPVVEMVFGPLTTWNAPRGVAPRTDSPPLADYYRIPAVKQLLRMVAHICFTGLVSLSAAQNNPMDSDVWSGGSKSFSTTDKLLLVWALALALDEWYKYAVDKKTYAIYFWNKYDFTVITLTICSVLAHAYDYKLASEFLTMNVLFVWCRIFKYLSIINHDIGLLVIMLIEMLVDISVWTLVSSVFLGAFTVIFFSISDVTKIEEDTDATPLTVPFWASLGDFDVFEVAEWNPNVGQAMLFLYVLLSNIVLVNLLIAMMGHTFGVIKDRADEEWKFWRLESVLQTAERFSPIPPPLNLPMTLYYFFKVAIFGHPIEDPTASGQQKQSVSKKAMQKVARKLLNKHQLSIEQLAESMGAGKEETVIARINYVVREIADLKHAMSASEGTSRAQDMLKQKTRHRTRARDVTFSTPEPHVLPPPRA